MTKPCRLGTVSGCPAGALFVWGSGTTTRHIYPSHRHTHRHQHHPHRSQAPPSSSRIRQAEKEYAKAQVRRHSLCNIMDPTFATYQARLDTFGAPKSKSRRPSARGKKAAPKAPPKGGWPLSFPRPDDLAYAGFIFKPTSVSHDNVQCFNCQTQLDGWEETDTPAYEHLTHSPNCGFAINACIRLRSSDPGRTEDDPLSEAMLDARRQTFANLWPLNPEEGYPSIEQVQ